MPKMWCVFDCCGNHAWIIIPKYEDPTNTEWGQVNLDFADKMDPEHAPHRWEALYTRNQMKTLECEKIEQGIDNLVAAGKCAPDGDLAKMLRKLNNC